MMGGSVHWLLLQKKYASNISDYNLLFGPEVPYVPERRRLEVEERQVGISAHDGSAEERQVGIFAHVDSTGERQVGISAHVGSTGERQVGISAHVGSAGADM
jgi:hypothetical protein